MNIGLAFPLYAWLGIPGLALAFSLAYFVAAGLTLVVLHGRLDGIDGRRIATTVVKVAVAGVVGRRRQLGCRRAHRLVDTTVAAFAAVVGGAIVGRDRLPRARCASLRVEELASLTALVPGAPGPPRRV